MVFLKDNQKNKMEKIIIVFDKFFFLRMFVGIKDSKLSAEYFSRGEEKKDDEDKIEKLNKLLKEEGIILTGHESKAGNKEAVFYTRKITPEDPGFLMAVKQNLTDEEIFAKIIPAEAKELFKILEAKKLAFDKKKEVYSKILNSDDDFMIKTLEVIKKTEEILKNNTACN